VRTSLGLSIILPPSHFTVMNKVFDMAQTDFGQHLTGAPISTINEIVA